MIATALTFIFWLQNPGGSVLTGQLRSIQGPPAVAVRVSAIAAPSETSRPSFGSQYYYQDAPVSSALTDAQGRFRLTNVPPGRYFIVCGVTYFPTTIDPDRASVVTVRAGSNIDDLDFQLLRPLGGGVSGRIKFRDDRTSEKAILSGVNLQDILESPIAPDGAFEFGHVPAGDYLIDLVPPPPGMGSFAVQVGEKDVTDLELVPPVTHNVTGRIVVENGPLPLAHLAFATAHSYVDGPINPDGTFTVRLHSARHAVELAGMPVGYAVRSVKVDSKDASEGLTVGNADVSNVVITVGAPRDLPRIRGTVAGLSGSRRGSAKVEMTGPIVGRLEAAIRSDGSFEIPAATPGMYRLKLVDVPEAAPMDVVVTWHDADVRVTVPSR